MLDKMSNEGRDCLAPLAQRRNHDGGGVEPVVEVVAELPRLDHRAQVAIGRRDQPNINRVGARRADRLDLVGLDRAQQLGLEAQRQLADFVQEQGAAVGRAEIAKRILARVGESAAHMAEELRLGQRLDQVGAIEGHERAARDRAQRMQRPRDELLAGAGFAVNQHRCFVWTQARNGFEYLADLR